jgi:excisionase family DNA binding protein
MTPRDALQALVAAVPVDAAVTVPAAWVRELLGGAPTTVQAPVVADLGVPELAALLRFKPSTVRGWLEQGRFPGAYLLGRRWRVPPDAVNAFQAREREGVPPMAAQRQSVRQRGAQPQPGATPIFDALTTRESHD